MSRRARFTPAGPVAVARRRARGRRMHGRPAVQPARAADASRPPLRAGRPGGVDRRRALVGRREGPGPAEARTRGGGQQPRSALGDGARRRGARAVRDRAIVPLPAGRGRGRLLGRAGLAPHGAAAGDRGRQALPELERWASPRRGSSTSSAGSAPRSRRGSPPTSRRSTAVARRSSRSWRKWPRRTSCCASSTCSSTSRAGRWRRTTRRCAYYRSRLEGGVSNRLELDRAVANRARTATVIPTIERQIAVAENAECLLLARPPGPIERGEALSDQRVPPEIPVGLPAALLERRPDVLARRAAAGRRQRERGRGEGAVLPDDLSHGASRDDQRRAARAC